MSITVSIRRRGVDDELTLDAGTMLYSVVNHSTDNVFLGGTKVERDTELRDGDEIETTVISSKAGC